MDTYYWKTEESHHDNNVTMGDYLNHHMTEDWEVTFNDGTYAEVVTDDGVAYGVHASGDGDSFNHKVEFESLPLPTIITNTEALKVTHPTTSGDD